MPFGMIDLLAALSLAVADPPIDRPDLAAFALTVDIALEDAGPCEAELQRGDLEGPRCEVFLQNWRAAIQGGQAVLEWHAAGLPDAQRGDRALADRALAAERELGARGERILRRIDILRGD
jgi:hypothetical protein